MKPITYLLYIDHKRQTKYVKLYDCYIADDAATIAAGTTLKDPTKNCNKELMTSLPGVVNGVLNSMKQKLPTSISPSKR